MHKPRDSHHGSCRLTCVLLRSGDRQREVKACAGSGRALNPDFSEMPGDKGLRNEEAQLRALRGGHGGRHFGKFIEDLRQMVRVDPAAGIGNARLNKPLGSGAELNRDTAVGRRELDRIAHEIPENLLELVAVAVDERKSLNWLNLKGHLLFRSHRLQAARGKSRNLTNADRFEAERLFLETRPIEQLSDDPGQPGDIVFDTGEVGGLLFVQRSGHAVEHVFRKAANGRHGSPQFMRHDGEKRRALSIDLLQLIIGEGQLLGSGFDALLEMLREFR